MRGAGGIGLIAAADWPWQRRGATFAFTEVRVGVAPAMILVPALGVIDRRFLARGTLTGERFGAAEAAAAGLLSAVTPMRRPSTPGWRTQTRRSARPPPGAVRATKELLRVLRGRVGRRLAEAAARRPSSSPAPRPPKVWGVPPEAPARLGHT